MYAKYLAQLVCVSFVMLLDFRHPARASRQSSRAPRFARSLSSLCAKKTFAHWLCVRPAGGSPDVVRNNSSLNRVGAGSLNPKAGLWVVSNGQTKFSSASRKRLPTHLRGGSRFQPTQHIEQTLKPFYSKFSRKKIKYPFLGPNLYN